MSAKNRIKVAGLVIAVVGLVVTSIPGASAGVSQSLTPSVIVRFETGTAGQVVAEVSQLRGTVVRRNDAVNSMAVAIPPSRAAVLARHPNVITLSANAAVKFQANVWKADVDLGSLYVSTKGYGVHTAWGHGALERHEFVVHYQPIVDMWSQELLGAEALVRWQHPTLGLLPPAQFLGLAFESRQLVAIDTEVLDLACTWLAGMDATSTVYVRWVSVNASSRTLREPELVDRVQAALGRNGLAPSRLLIEVTEDLVADDAARAIAILLRLKDIGVGLALDDFGTGYSSLGYLRELEVETIKVAEALVNELDSSQDQQALARAIVALSGGLRKRVIVEGIERPAQIEVLRSMGCDAGQGFHFSPAVPDAEFRAWCEGSEAAIGSVRAPGVATVITLEAGPDADQEDGQDRGRNADAGSSPETAGPSLW